MVKNRYFLITYPPHLVHVAFKRPPLSICVSNSQEPLAKDRNYVNDYLSALNCHKICQKSKKMIHIWRLARSTLHKKKLATARAEIEEQPTIISRDEIICKGAFFMHLCFHEIFLSAFNLSQYSDLPNNHAANLITFENIATYMLLSRPAGLLISEKTCHVCILFFT